ncbi:MAG TPA: hypothetical protein ENH82_13005 [bacterium]|nr:hypothetical protein [bacterium]
MSESYAIHRKQILAISSTFAEGGAFTAVIPTGRYKNISYIARTNSGVANIDFRTGIDSAMTIAMSGTQNALALGVTAIASFSALYGSHMEFRVSGVDSATNVWVFAYGMQT